MNNCSTQGQTEHEVGEIESSQDLNREEDVVRLHAACWERIMRAESWSTGKLDPVLQPWKGKPQWSFIELLLWFISICFYKSMKLVAAACKSTSPEKHI